MERNLDVMIVNSYALLLSMTAMNIHIYIKINMEKNHQQI